MDNINPDGNKDFPQITFHQTAASNHNLPAFSHPNLFEQPDNAQHETNAEDTHHHKTQGTQREQAQKEMEENAIEQTWSERHQRIAMREYNRLVEDNRRKEIHEQAAQTPIAESSAPGQTAFNVSPLQKQIVKQETQGQQLENKAESIEDMQKILNITQQLQTVIEQQTPKPHSRNIQAFSAPAQMQYQSDGAKHVTQNPQQNDNQENIAETANLQAEAWRSQMNVWRFKL